VKGGVMADRFMYVKGYYRTIPNEKKVKKMKKKMRLKKAKLSKIPYFERFFARNHREVLNSVLAIWIISFLFLFFGGNAVYAKRVHTEKWYQEKWCKQRMGKTEVRTRYNTRID